MKRKITLSIALVMSVVLVSLMSSERAAQAQNQIRVVANTGVVTLGANQKLRLTFAWDLNNDGVFVRFRRVNYTQDICSGGVCKLIATSQTVSDPIAVMPGEVVSLEVTDDNPLALGVIILSNSRNVRVNAMIISATGEVVGLFDANDCGPALFDAAGGCGPAL